MNFDEPPLSSLTLVLLVLNLSLSNLTTAEFALLSTAGSRTKISKNSPVSSVFSMISGPFLELGFTFTRIFIFKLYRLFLEFSIGDFYGKLC